MNNNINNNNDNLNGDWAQSPIPNPQSPIPNPHKLNLNNIILILLIYK